MAKKAETALQRRIHAALRKAYPDGKFFKIHGSSFQESGQPDLIGCINGQFYGFEVKLPFTGKPSPLQIETLEAWREAGAVACFVETPGQALCLVAAIEASSGKRRKGRKLYRWICRTLRATYGQDMGYGRVTNARTQRVPRRSARWALDELRVNMVKIPDGKTTLVFGAP